MAVFRVGDAVRLKSHYPVEIESDGVVVPVGSVGTIVGALDRYLDHAVLFPGWPCPAGPSSDWEVPAIQLEPAVLVDGYSGLEQLRLAVIRIRRDCSPLW